MTITIAIVGEPVPGFPPHVAIAHSAAALALMRLVEDRVRSAVGADDQAL